MELNVTKIVLGSDFILIVVLSCLGSSLLGAALITPVMSLVFKNLKSSSQAKTHPYAMLIGMIERPFYTFAVCFGAYIMVGGWLVLKAFSNVDAEKRDIPGFYVYLLGNILSIFIGTAFGFMSTFLIIRYAYS